MSRPLETELSLECEGGLGKNRKERETERKRLILTYNILETALIIHSEASVAKMFLFRVGFYFLSCSVRLICPHVYSQQCANLILGRHVSSKDPEPRAWAAESRRRAQVAAEEGGKLISPPSLFLLAHK